MKLSAQKNNVTTSLLTETNILLLMKEFCGTQLLSDHAPCSLVASSRQNSKMTTLNTLTDTKQAEIREELTLGRRHWPWGVIIKLFLMASVQGHALLK